MSQEFTQGFNGGNGGTTSYTTGSIIPATGLYKSTDGKIEFVEYMEAGQLAPPFPGGNGTKKCSWSRLSKTTDGSRTGFTSVKVAAGSI